MGEKENCMQLTLLYYYWTILMRENPGSFLEIWNISISLEKSLQKQILGFWLAFPSSCCQLSYRSATKCIDSGVLWDSVFLDVFSLWQSPVLISNFRSMHNDKGLSITLCKCKWKLPLLDPLRPNIFANKDSLCNSPLKAAIGGQEKSVIQCLKYPFSCWEPPFDLKQDT